MNLDPLPDRRVDRGGEIRILVVDDEEGARLTIKDIVEEMGYTVRTAANGAEALELAQSQSFAIALLDIRLPGMTGTELLRRLKAAHPETACVMVTGHATLDSSVAALNEGAAAYVTKPLEMAVIMAVIREQAEKYCLAQENRRMLAVLSALQAIGEVGLSDLDLESLPARLLDRLVRTIGGESGALVLADSGQEADAGPIRVGSSDTVEAYRALRLRQPLIAPTPDQGLCLALPLRVRGECIGGVQINAPAGRCFAVGDPSLAAALADRAALALENARLHDRERRSAREAQTLFRVAESLVSTLHLEDRLLIIAQTLAEVAGCACCLLFLRRLSTLAPVAAHGLTADEQETFSAMGTDLFRLDGAVRQAVEGGRTLVVEDGRTDPDVSRAFFSLWRIRSALALPLVVGSEVIGAAMVYTPDAKRPPSPHDVRLCEAVANQAAIAIENARAFERERNIAGELQQSFLSSAPQQLGTLRLASRYYAALKEAQVGGDFYDIIECVDGRVGLLMADVSGKGLSAAVHAAMGKYMLRAFAFERPDPAEALRRLNAALFHYSAQIHEVFITMFFAVVDTNTGEMQYVNAGHPPALLWRGSSPNRGMRLGSTGALVGAFRDAVFFADRVRIERGDMLVLYTNGVTDARSGREFFGIERLEAVLAQHVGDGAESAADAIHDAVQEFTGRWSHDDIALIVAHAAL